MKPSSLIHIAKISSNGQIVINGDGANKISLIGSSVPANISLGNYVNCLVIEPTKPGILAVSVYARTYDGSYFGFIVAIKKDNDGKLYVDGNRNNETLKGRLAGIVDRRLEVRTEGKLFLSSEPKDKEGYPSYRVANPNVLCQFLAGDINLEELETNASKLEEEKTAIEEVARLKVELDSSYNTIRSLHEKLSQLENKLKDQMIEGDKARGLKLRKISQSSWGLKKRLQGFIEENYPNKTNPDRSWNA